MGIHADSFFAKSKNHIACGDYAISINNPFPMAIVCDGCSSSSYSDIGSRILAHSAKKCMLSHYESGDLMFNISHDTLGKSIIINSCNSCYFLGLTCQALDSTLLLAYHTYNEIRVLTFGDGIVVLRNKNGTLHFFEISYKNNMPYYLSYDYDKTRRQEYFRQSEGGKNEKICKAVTCINGDFYSASHPVREGLTFRFPVEEFLFVGVCSDGMSQFKNLLNNEFLETSDILFPFTDFKNVRGSFIQRRVKRELSDLAQKKIVNIDDIAISGIWIPEEY